LKLKIKNNRHCCKIYSLYSWRFNAVGFSGQPRKS